MATGEGVLSNIARTEVFGVPIGAAATGALVAGVWDGISGLASGFIPNIPDWAVKGVGAVVTIRWMPNLVGREAANVAGLLLTYDAIQSMFPIRDWVKNIFSGFKTSTSSAVASPAPQGTPETLEQYLAARGL